MKEKIYLFIKTTNVYSGVDEAMWNSYDVFIKSEYGELLLKQFDNKDDVKEFMKRIKINLK